MNVYKCKSNLRFPCRVTKTDEQAKLKCADGFEDLSRQLSHYLRPEDPTTPDFYMQRLVYDRKVAFVHGSKDRGAGDERPEAMAQGKSFLSVYHVWLGRVSTDERTRLFAWITGRDRVQRALNYHKHLSEIEVKVGMRDGRGRKWSVDWIPGVGHDGKAM